MEEIREELNRRTCYDSNRTLLWCSFSLFMFFMLWITIFKACRSEVLLRDHTFEFAQLNIHDRFMWQFKKYTKNFYKYLLDSDSILNILMFLPMGIYLPLLMKKSRFGWGTLISFFIVLVIELTELFDRLGGFEFLDFALNLLGYMLGYFIFKLVIERWCTAKVVNGINIGIITITTPIMLWAIVYTSIHWEWYYMFYSI